MRASWLRACAVAAVLAAAAPAPAEDLREFAGTVTQASGASLTVENRMGDRRRFQGGGDTQVTGARSRWQELRAGDSVLVAWSIEDKPVRARRVRVLGGR